jgi:dTDP-4-amino-4,6-dideoxygalactose transaminase
LGHSEKHRKRSVSDVLEKKEKLALIGGSPVRTKPFKAWPAASPQAKRNLQKVIDSNGWGIFRGSNVRAFGEKFAQYHGARYGIPCANATIALEIQLRALGIKPGDEVITTVYTCIPTVTGILNVGAIPVFVDIDENTYCIDPKLIEGKITVRTKAIIVVHLYGSIADLDAVGKVAKRHKLYLIEDAAQVPGSFWNGKAVGAYGVTASFSFQEAKSMSAGEGGIILTNNRELAEIMRSYINCGRITPHDRTKRRVLGGNYRMTEFQAAILLAQLDSLETESKKRAENAKRLTRGLNGIPGIKTLAADRRTTMQTYYLYVFSFPRCEGISREAFINAINAEGIPTRSTYVPLYRNELFNLNRYDSPMAWKYYKRNKPSRKQYPIAEKVAAEIVAFWHPLLSGSKKDVDDIVRAVRKVMDLRHQLQGA